MYGGGVQSCAIAALICQGKIPVPDISVIADTGREKQSTWDYLRDVVQPALKGKMKIEIVSKDEFATVDLWRNQTLLLPTFTTESGEVGKLPTYCSNEWKKRVIERWLRKQKVKKFKRWIGFSLDEANRALRMSGDDGVWFPLIDGVPMTRQSCVATVESLGWPTPPRSSCWMCPNMRHGEWQDMKENRPEDFKKAVALEIEVRKKDPHVFFHRSCKPLGRVDFEREDDLFSRPPCDSGLCFI